MIKKYNDIFSDNEKYIWNKIKEEYKALLSISKCEQDIEQLIINREKKLFIENEYICYLSLASVESDYGRLSKNTQERAIKLIIENKNKHQFNELESKLKNNHNLKKNKPHIIHSKAYFEIGDVVILKLDGIPSNNIYVALHCVGVDYSNIGLIPIDLLCDEYNIFRVFKWTGQTEPTIDDLKKTNYYDSKLLKENSLLSFLLFDRFSLAVATNKEQSILKNNFKKIGNLKVKKSYISNDICFCCIFSSTRLLSKIKKNHTITKDD